MLRLTNNSMNLELIALIGDNALLKRLNDTSFVVVNGLNIHNDFTCEWNFAYGYFEKYTVALQCFNEKVLKVLTEDVKEVHPYIRVTEDTASGNYLTPEDCYEVEIIKNTPPCDTSFKIEMIDNQFLNVTRSELDTLKDMLNNDKVQEFLGI